MKEETKDELRQLIVKRITDKKGVGYYYTPFSDDHLKNIINVEEEKILSEELSKSLLFASFSHLTHNVCPFLL